MVAFATLVVLIIKQK
ncbi:hypothetical protein [Sporomusa sp. GT1]